MVQEHETDQVWNHKMDCYVDIDRKIVPLIKALWRLGIETMFSCEANTPLDNDHIPANELCVWVEFKTMYDFCHFMSIMDHNVARNFVLNVVNETWLGRYEVTSVSVRFYPIFLEEVVCALNRAYTQNIKIDIDDPKSEICERDTPHVLRKLRQLLDRYNNGYKCHISLKNDEFVIEFYSCKDYERLVRSLFRYFTRQDYERMFRSMFGYFTQRDYKHLFIDENETDLYDRTRASLHLIVKNKRLYVSLSWRIKMEDLHYIEGALKYALGG